MDVKELAKATDVKERAKALNDTIVALRRELHAHPEVDHDLPVTESIIVRELFGLGLDDIKAGQGRGHGVFATLKGAKPGKVLALRADMDALPIIEETGLPFAASNGMMHACGHDAHVAMLLVTAKMLAAARDELAGTVRFIFQPAEETVCGALSMIESGALLHPKVDEIIGIHTGSIWDGLNPGQIGWRAGAFMAGTSRLTISFEGKGGHGATPHLTVDPIMMAAETITQLQTVVSREVSPFEPVVVTVGKIEGGSASNIIAERCKAVGTVRTFSPATAAFVKDRIRTTAEGVASTMRGCAEVTFDWDIPAVVNDATCARRMRDIVTRTMGGDFVGEITHPSSGSEDFAFFLEKIPGAFFYHCGAFGSSSAGENVNFPHHHPKFNINESVLWTGAAAMTAYALNWQNQGGQDA